MTTLRIGKSITYFICFRKYNSFMCIMISSICTFQELLKEIAIWKPEDPLLYIRDELTRIGRSVYTPKVFMLGPEPGKRSFISMLKVYSML
jgi:hypothetical protein